MRPNAPRSYVLQLPILQPHSRSKPLAPTSREPVPHRWKEETRDVQKNERTRAAQAAPTHLGVLRVCLHSFNSAQVQSPLGARGPGSRGGVGELCQRSRDTAVGEGAQAGGPLGSQEGPRSCARAARRTGPGRQCAFVYVARAAAANMHLKSPRVSARQRSATQSPRRRTPRTPGPRSLWYISDLTSRAGLILRWEPYCVHLGSRLGRFCFFFFFFPREV